MLLQPITVQFSKSTLKPLVYTLETMQVSSLFCNATHSQMVLQTKFMPLSI